MLPRLCFSRNARRFFSSFNCVESVKQAFVEANLRVEQNSIDIDNPFKLQLFELTFQCPRQGKRKKILLLGEEHAASYDESLFNQSIKNDLKLFDAVCVESAELNQKLKDSEITLEERFARVGCYSLDSLLRSDRSTISVAHSMHLNNELPKLFLLERNIQFKSDFIQALYKLVNVHRDLSVKLTAVASTSLYVAYIFSHWEVLIREMQSALAHLPFMEHTLIPVFITSALSFSSAFGYQLARLISGHVMDALEGLEIKKTFHERDMHMFSELSKKLNAPEVETIFVSVGRAHLPGIINRFVEVPECLSCDLVGKSFSSYREDMDELSENLKDVYGIELARLKFEP
ncbi:MAG: hypothetical protein ACE365_00705 [Gammaproteobacteria bacterium]